MAAAPAAVDVAPIGTEGEPTHAHFIKRARHGFDPVVQSPGCFTIRASYDIFIPTMNKSIVTTEVLVKLPMYCIGIISCCQEWKFGELINNNGNDQFPALDLHEGSDIKPLLPPSANKERPDHRNVGNCKQV
jgi:hypothetical protein